LFFLIKGKAEYLIKWKNYGDVHNSWEPEENLNDECLNDFNNRFVESKKRKSTYSDEESSSNEKQTSKKTCPLHNDLRVRGFVNRDNLARGSRCNQKPECITGATDITGELVFLVKYQNSDEYNLVPSSVANKKFPQIVIKFYESHYIWNLRCN